MNKDEFLGAIDRRTDYWVHLLDEDLEDKPLVGAREAILVLHERLEAMETKVAHLEKRGRMAPEVVFTSAYREDNARMLDMLAKVPAGNIVDTDADLDDFKADMLREMLELRELIAEGFHEREWVTICAAKQQVERLIESLTK